MDKTAEFGDTRPWAEAEDNPRSRRRSMVRPELHQDSPQLATSSSRGATPKKQEERSRTPDADPDAVEADEVPAAGVAVAGAVLASRVAAGPAISAAAAELLHVDSLLTD